jgi:hypothetical protein
MDRTTKDNIESFIWNVTVGAGVDPEECSIEPDEDAMAGLARVLGHPVTGEETDVALRHWRRCLMEIAMP